MWFGSSEAFGCHTECTLMGMEGALASAYHPQPSSLLKTLEVANCHWDRSGMLQVDRIRPQAPPWPRCWHLCAPCLPLLTKPL